MSFFELKKIKVDIDQDKTAPHDAIISNNHEIKVATKPIFYEFYYYESLYGG